MNNNTYIRKNLYRILTDNLVGHFRLPEEIVITDKGTSTHWSDKTPCHHFIVSIEVWQPNLVFDPDNSFTEPDDITQERGFWEPVKAIITLDENQEVRGVIVTGI